VSERAGSCGRYPRGARQARPTETGSTAASRSYVGRMSIFFGERIPLGRTFALAALIYLVVAGFVSVAVGSTMRLWQVSTAVGIVSVFCLSLMLRLMDEIKDLDTDRKLFPDRPLPSMRVRLSDVRSTLVIVILFYLGTNLFVGAAPWTALVVLGYLLLMFRFFFIPQIIRRSLLLALVTHNPIIPLMLLHCVAVAGHQGDFAELRWSLIGPFVLMMWAPLLAWEISRKIRAPAEETEYVTYSRVLGLRSAIAFTLAVQTISAAICFYLSAKMGFTFVAPVIVAAMLAVSWAAHLRLLIHPRHGSWHLEMAAQGFGVTVFASQFCFLVLPSLA